MTIHKLLVLESEAKEAMQALEKEQAFLAKKAQEDLMQRMIAFEKAKRHANKKAAKETEANAAEAITKTQAEYKQKRSEKVHTFTAKGNIWKDQVFHHVITFRP